MANQQFRVRHGLKSDGEVTFTGPNRTGTPASGGKVLTLDANANVFFRTHANIKADVDAGKLDGVVAGEGITVTAVQGGGVGTDTQTITLGTPSTLNTTSTDSTAVGTHAHNITTASDASGVSVATILAANTTGGLKVADLHTSANVVVAGSLQVDGTLTYVNTVNLSVSDPLITLSANHTGTSTNDQGLLINRGDASNVAFIWDESEDRFATVLTANDGTSLGNMTISSHGDLAVGTLHGKGAQNSTNSSTGDIILDGGQYIAKSLRVAGDSFFTDTTNATSNTTGALKVTGGASVEKSFVTGGDIKVWTDIYRKDETRSIVATASISNSANSYLFQIPCASYSAAEVVLKLKAGSYETQIHKYLVSETGSGTVDFTEYGSIGHEINATINFETTDGSGDSSGATHIAMNVLNNDGVTITCKAEATFFAV